jgi:hypothetical protein
LSFKHLALLLLPLLFTSCTKIYQQDREVSVKFYDTQRIMDRDIFFWATYLSRETEGEFSDGEYFVVGYFIDPHNEALYKRLSPITPTITRNGKNATKLTKLDQNHTLLKRLPYVTQHSLNFLVRFDKIEATTKKVQLKLDNYTELFRIELED